MRKSLSRNPDLILLWIVGYFLLAIIVRIIRSPALEIDETQAALTQFLLWGYGSQPPLYHWLQYGLSELFGMSIATLSLLKNATLFFSCLFFWLTVRLLTQDRALSGLATLGMLTLPPIFLMSQRDLSHTVMALLTVCLFLYAFFSTLKRPSFAGYLLAGAAVGLGALSKYNFILVPLAAALALIPEKDLRTRLMDWRMLLAVILSILIVLPHAIWMLHHPDLVTGQTMGEMTEGREHISFHGFDGALDLVLAALKGAALTVAIFAALFYRDIKRIVSASDQWTRIIGRMLLIVFFLLLVIIFVLGATNIRQKWLIVYLVLLPLYLSLKIRAAGVEAKPKLPAMLTVASVLTIGVLLILLTRGLVAPYFGRYSIVHIPYDTFAKAVMRDGFAQPRYVIAPNVMVGGNLRIQFPNATVLTGDPAIERAPQTFPQGATVLLAGTTDDGKLPEDPAAALDALAARSSPPAPTDIRDVSVAYRGGDGTKKHAFYYAWSVIGRN
jgi:4-amino-4-deoxy-L-arabinose transferase-like glycosyltransferase